MRAAQTQEKPFFFLNLQFLFLFLMGRNSQAYLHLFFF